MKGSLLLFLPVVVGITFTSGLPAQPAAGTQERWFLRTDIQGLVARYSGSSARDGLNNFGIFLRADYLERGGFTIGYNRTALNLADGGHDVGQDNLYLSGRMVLTPDAFDGRFTLRLDAHDLSNDAAGSRSDAVRAAMAQIAYLNYAETFYWDLGFARSDHDAGGPSGERLELDQLTPTIGFGLNQRRDWLQLRAYLIDVAGPRRVQREESTSAIELKWTHWLPPNGFLGLENIRLGILGGERLLAIDHDAATVYNLSELQTGGFSAGGEWAIGERSHVLLLVGTEDYENQDLPDEYRSPFLYLNFSREWD